MDGEPVFAPIEHETTEVTGIRNADGLGFAAFGRVNDGMDVVRRIHALPADAATEQANVTGQIIEKSVASSRARRAP